MSGSFPFAKALATPATTSLPPPPPPPLPQPNLDDSSDDDGGEDSNDEGDDVTSSETSILPFPSQALGLNPPLSIPITSSIAITSGASAASSTDPSASFPGTKNTSSNTKSDSQTTTSLRRTSSTSRAVPTPSSSTSTSQTLSSITSSETSANSSTALPVDQPNGISETHTRHSSLSIAGFALASIFGFVALLTAAYMLYRFRRRRATDDREKQKVTDTSVQETGVIFGRGRNGRNTFGAQDNHDQSGVQQRSRFGFFTGRLSGNRSQLSDIPDHNTSSTFPSNMTTSPSILHWPSPLFFTRGISLPRWSSSNTDDLHNQTSSMIPRPPPAQIHNHPSDSNRTTTIADTPMSYSPSIQPSTQPTSLNRTGSGHARAYAHHGIRAPARSTASSTSSVGRSWRWTRRTQMESNRVSVAQSTLSLPVQRVVGSGGDNPINPVSPVSMDGH